jgi:tetratricopeptide (TPR) repeat protein
MAWEQTSRASLYNSAVGDCTKAIALNPENEGAYVHRCDLYINLGNFSAAVADCTKAITLNPNNKDAYLGRGLAYEGLDNNAAANEDFAQVLKIDPSNQAAQTELSRAASPARNP